MRTAWFEIILILILGMAIHAWGYYNGVKAAQCGQYQQEQVKK